MEKDKLWEKCMDMLIEIENQYGMGKVRKVARQLWEQKILDTDTYSLLLFDELKISVKISG